MHIASAWSSWTMFIVGCDWLKAHKRCKCQRLHVPSKVVLRGEDGLSWLLKYPLRDWLVLGHTSQCKTGYEPFTGFGAGWKCGDNSWPAFSATGECTSHACWSTWYGWSSICSMAYSSSRWRNWYTSRSCTSTLDTSKRNSTWATRPRGWLSSTESAATMSEEITSRDEGHVAQSSTCDWYFRHMADGWLWSSSLYSAS